MWEDISFEDKLIDEDSITKIVNSLIYDKSPSVYIGNIGDNLDFEAVCTRSTVSNNSNYGLSYFMVFQDDAGNIYTWGTQTKQYIEGKRYHIKGKVKDHNMYKNICQTNLTRCRLEEIK